MAKKKAEEISKGLNRILETAKKSALNNEKEKTATNIAKTENKAANQKEIGKKTVSIEQKPEDFPPFVKINLGIDPNFITEVKEEMTKEEYKAELDSFSLEEDDIFSDLLEISKYKFKFVKSKTK